MPQLPDHPDLAQLRRQARELQRAAADGDPGARRRIQPVSAGIALSAQLALAREYGFGSWAKLKQEAERRRASAPGTGRETTAPAASWRDFLAADGDDDPDTLIEGQYADRPRPSSAPAGLFHDRDQKRPQPPRCSIVVVLTTTMLPRGGQRCRLQAPAS